MTLHAIVPPDDLMHQVTFGPAGSYPRTVCGAHHIDRARLAPFRWCGPRFLAEHCARLTLEPCPPCWEPPAEQLALDVGAAS